jgi:hypothetical protein
MSKKDKAIIELLLEFLREITVEPRRWYAEERLKLNRLFPDQAFDMLIVWYNSSGHKSVCLGQYKFHSVLPNTKTFIPYFEQALSIYGIKCTRVKSKGNFNLSKYPFNCVLKRWLHERGLKAGITCFVRDEGGPLGLDIQV